MKKALLVIDYTYDFVADDGKLTCGKPGQAIEQTISSLIEKYVAANELVVFTNDIHYENDEYHPETKLFPPHNIAGTAGRDLYGMVKDVYEKHKNGCISLNKTRYSAFAGTNLHQLLQERGIRDIALVGVCTDICVLHTAVDAYNLGYHVTVYKNGVASFNTAGHDWALEHFTNTLGAKVI
ncbi:isochorismatase family cysteine hydrolase [Lysinibacillus sp. KU-BSD001]|uniref:cysteine hydrolase family protein n=1 Tax=Lysinibacillus sp. KU-BSD001 TaxID=3141328 RepID=UPI0036EBB1DE